MKNIKSVVILVLCFLLGMVTINLITGCKQQKPTQPSSPAGAADDTSGEGESGETPTEGVPEEQPEDAGDAEDSSEAAAKSDGSTSLLGFELDEDGNPVHQAGSWSQWGGTSYRNNVPVGVDIPTSWAVGSFDRRSGEWNSEEAENIKWVARVGSQTYGNPVVAGGRVFVGTNNSAGYLPRYPARVDLGCMICFSEEDGSLLWQHSSEKLSTGRVHDWPLQGICCAPLVEGDRLWFVSSRGEVICADTEGYYDGEDDGPVKEERARLFDIRKGDDPETDAFVPAVTALAGGLVNRCDRSS